MYNLSDPDVVHLYFGGDHILITGQKAGACDIFFFTDDDVRVDYVVHVAAS